MSVATTLAGLDREGWMAIPGFLAAEQAASLAARCAALLGAGADANAADADGRLGDKRVAGTQRAAALTQRLPDLAAAFDHPVLQEALAHLLGAVVPLSDVAFRCPQPGFGSQSLHADDVPVERAGQCRAVTAIVALCDFTETNGATAVLPGSHLRPDLQRRAGRSHLADRELVLTGPIGTAFVFSAHLVHRGTRNGTDHPRPALQAQWRPAPPG